jgi:peptide/nickel transport system substrate-binding protein
MSKNFFRRLIVLMLLISSQVYAENLEYNNKKTLLKLKISSEPSRLNPILSVDTTSSTVESFIFNGLFTVNESLELVPELASHYKISKDQKTYTFYLKKNVSWHDGHPFTAEDVKFTFDTILDPKTNTVRRSSFIIDGKPVKIDVIDSHTVSFTLPQIFSPFLTRISMSIIPKHIFENEDINTSSYNIKPIGTGPFKFSEWKTGQFILLEKNKDYFNKSPKIDQVTFSIINDPNAALISLKKEEIHISDIQPKDISDISTFPHIDIHQFYGLSYSFVAFNLSNPHFKDKRVRQALSHALNKEALVKGVLNNRGKAAYIPSSPLLWSYPKKEINILEFNTEKTKKLLFESGYRLNKKTNILEKNGVPFTFTLITNKGNKEREKTAQIIQQVLKKLHIKVEIQILEWSALLNILNTPIENKKFDTLLFGWSLSIEPDSYSIWHSSQSPKGFNFIGYDNPKVDALLEQGRKETNQEKRAQIYQEMYTLIIEDAPYIFLYYPESNIGSNKKLQGLSKAGPAGLMINKESLYLTE